LVLFFAAFALAGAARAYASAPDPGPPIVSDAEIKRIFGSVKYEPWCYRVWGVTGVKIIVENINEDGLSAAFDAAARELVRRGLPYAWELARKSVCHENNNYDPYAVREIEIQRGSGWLGGNFYAKNYHRIDASNQYAWGTFTQNVASYQWWAFWFKVVVLLSILGTCIYNWETFLHWYYFYFYPHPARGMVQQALNTRTVLDGPALAAALGEVPKGNSIFKKVRLEQGEALFARMQAMSRSIEAGLQRAAAAGARATAREYERKAAEGYEAAALHAIQEAIALAAVALERAKSAWQTSEAIRKRGTA
jgi:hypothetical protein